jgi:hypothetical protein
MYFRMCELMYVRSVPIMAIHLYVYMYMCLCVCVCMYVVSSGKKYIFMHLPRYQVIH